MHWNWEQAGWPQFVYDSKALEALEQQFLLGSGELVGAFKHVGGGDRQTLRIDLISDEAIKTSEIEGEILNRDSVQSSLRHRFGLDPEKPNIPRAERGIAQLMVELYEHFATRLSDDILFSWHRMLMEGSSDIRTIGGYRVHEDPMQVVSGPSYKRIVHFEAPPSKRMLKEMRGFMSWFNDTAPKGNTPLPALTRAGIAHLYFVCIHPFEDGNGRIGRAIAEKSLAQNLGHPSLIALAYTIAHKPKDYYAALERNNQDLEITDWLEYFGRTILQAQTNTIGRVDFYVAKAKFYGRHRDQLSERQAKVVARIFEEGMDGFSGGLSAENYIAITKASRATTTRDLQDLVEKGALTRTGELRHTRYYLALER
jgi:Fic family protein